MLRLIIWFILFQKQRQSTSFMQSCQTLAPSVVQEVSSPLGKRSNTSMSGLSNLCVNPSPKRTQVDMHTHLLRTSDMDNKLLNAKVTEYVYACNLPFSIVEHPSSIALIDALLPGYKLSSRQRLGGKLLDNTHMRSYRRTWGKNWLAKWWRYNTAWVTSTMIPLLPHMSLPMGKASSMTLPTQEPSEDPWGLQGYVIGIYKRCRR